MRNILYSFVALFLILFISSCGENDSTVTQTDAQTSVTLAADKSQVIADGTDGVTLTVTVKDATGAPLVQQEVSFNIPVSLSFSYLPLLPLTTDKNGQVILFLRQLGPNAISLLNQYPMDIKQGDVTASCMGVTSSPITITVKPRPPVITSSVTLVADKLHAFADGRDAITFTATVKDGTGALIPYQNINFNVSPGASRYMSPGYTDANGLAVIRLTSPLNTLNDKVIDVIASSGAITSNTVSVTYSVPPPIIPASVTLIADKVQAVADSMDVITITAIAKDGNGLPIPQQSISFSVSPAGINPFVSAIRSNANGLSVIHLTSRPNTLNDRIFNVTATSNGISSNTVVITYSAPPQVAPALVTLASDKTTLIIDGNDQINFTITATDSSGNPSVGQVFSLNIPSGPYMYTSQPLTNTAGQASSTLHSVLRLPVITSPTIKSVTATINGTTSNAINITFTPP